MSSRASLKYFLFFLCLAAPLAMPFGATASAFAQQAAATVRGTIDDPDNAVIPGATVTLAPTTGKAYTATSQPDGSYVIRNVPGGIYAVTVTMNGFASFVKQGVHVNPGQSLVLDAKLAIQAQSQEVQVTAQGAQVSVDQDNNASSTVIKDKDLDALSDDPDELNSELTALAGPAAGPNGGQIYVDGFTGGQLPPKSSIREIRVNQNPFSAQYDRLGYGRVEIFTKPGTDKFHGNFNLQGNNKSFNTSNPFLGSTNSQPGYHTVFFFGGINGPLTSFSSFTLNGSYRDIQSNSIVNPAGFYAASPGSSVLCRPGQSGCSNVGGYPASARAISNPQTRYDINPRVDLALGEKNTLVIRYQYETGSVQNGGIGNLTLPTAGYNTSQTENTIQISDTQLISPRVVNETRFEYQHEAASQTALSTDPSISIQGVLNGGGASAQSSTTAENHIEVQNYTSFALAKNFIRFGGRLRTTNEDFSSNSGQNGSFTYNYLLDPCTDPTITNKPSTCTAASAALPPCTISGASSYQCGVPSQFNITTINKLTTSGRDTDLGVYAEDDWKARPNLTITYGLRFEAQNFINSTHDFSPRVSFAYGIPRKNGNPITVVRGGYGIFYDRFSLSNLITTQQQNGLNQVQSIFKNVTAACSPANPSACQTGTAAARTTYSLGANTRSSYTLQAAIGVDQQIGRATSVSINYLNARGVHQYLSRDFPGAGSYSYQFQSAGVYREDQLLSNINTRLHNLTVFGFYALSFAKANTGGSTSFATNPYNSAVDYGRASFANRNRMVLGGTYSAPFLINVSPFIIANSGNPYNLTAGRDLNGDSLFNDRPYFRNAGSGNCFNGSDFDPNTPASGTPTAGETLVPINYCTGPANLTFNLRLSKTIGFGPQSDAARRQSQGGPGGPGGGNFGRGGGRGGRGGFGGATSGKRYNLTLGAQAQNLFNSVPYGTPVSSVSSPRFGQFTSLQGGPFSSATAVRRISLQAVFSF